MTFHKVLITALFVAAVIAAALLGIPWNAGRRRSLFALLHPNGTRASYVWRLVVGTGGLSCVIGLASAMEFAREHWPFWLVGIGYVAAMIGALGSGLTSHSQRSTVSAQDDKAP